MADRRETARVAFTTRRVNDLPLLERARIRLWLAATHGWRSRFTRFDWYVSAKADGVTVSIGGVVDRYVTIGDVPAHVGLLGGVLTDPPARGRGLASEIVVRATRLIENDLACDFAVLTCGDELVPFYERLGWTCVPNQLVFDRFGARRVVDSNVMVHERPERRFAEGVIDVKGLPA